MPSSRTSPAAIYLGTFLIAFSTLALEVTLARLLSVITWYHLSFFAVSTAMLGMTAGATVVYLKPEWFPEEKLSDAIARACLGYALVLPFSLIVLCLLPLDLKQSVMSLLALAAATTACAVPFFFAGIAVTAVLTKCPLPIGKIYASDLVGASLGCLFVLVGLDIVDAPSLILLCGSVGALAALIFAWGSTSFGRHRFTRWAVVGLTLFALANASSSFGIRPLVVKGAIEGAGAYFIERWNSFSRVVAYRGVKGVPQYWGPSPLAPRDKKIRQYKMKIDGEAGTIVRQFASTEDIEHLRFDVTNVAYYLRANGKTAVIGVGGGRDVQSALLFGHKEVVGIDLNPIFIDLLRNEFREFAGLADHPGVTLVVDEARSYLSRSKDEYSIIQMSLIDTWAATGVGAFSLSENALYTVEAWRIALSRLADDGIFTVSRWYGPSNLGETGRIASLAVAALLEDGVINPAAHIAMITTSRVSTLLLSKSPLSEHDIAVLEQVSRDLQYDAVILPGRPPGNAVLRKIMAATSLSELYSAIADEPLNYAPPTDENPYFFNMLRLTHLGAVITAEAGVMQGNLIATLTLTALIGCLVILVLATIVVPLVLRTRQTGYQPHSILWSGAVYFSLIGAGFMFIEIAMIQRLSVFLSHPVYALGILLFTIVLSAGIGSFISEQLPLTERPWLFVYPAVTVVVILIMRFALPPLMSGMVAAPMMTKILLSVAVMFPLGILLGFFFPTGMRMARAIGSADTPWYWALNGIFGVLCSALAVFFAIYFGISTNFYLAAVCYTAVIACSYRMARARSLLA